MPLVRLCKRWNKTKNATTIPSYMLETMIINFADSVKELTDWIDLNFRDALKFIAENIMLPVYDLKNIQGDLNTLSYSDKLVLKEKAQSDHDKACEARGYERDGEQKRAVSKWGEIFGKDFPQYG